MKLSKLLFNPTKTEFLLIGTKQQCLKFSDLTNLSLSNEIIPMLAILASSLSLTCLSMIKSTLSKSCHFHIRGIRRICHLLPLSTATALANSLVSSKLDYCNSLYSGIYFTSKSQQVLQHSSIQNSLAQVITNTSKYQSENVATKLVGKLLVSHTSERDLGVIVQSNLKVDVHRAGLTQWGARGTLKGRPCIMPHFSKN